MSDALLKQADVMRSALKADLARDGRLGKVRRYLDGDHNLPYMPRKFRTEYKVVAETSRRNWLPLVSDTYSDSLEVIGYRDDATSDNAAPWDWWQANGLDARQSIVHRGALEYGAAYVLVLPSVGSAPVIKPLDPLRSYALYLDEDDEYPEVFLYKVGKSALGDFLYDLYDDTNVYRLRVGKDGDDFTFSGPPARHGMPVVPVVRFRDRLDGRAKGIIAPLLPLQDHVNEVSFVTAVALQYASWRQRWAIGLEVDEEERIDPETGETVGYDAVEPFDAGVDRLWTSDSPDTKFGEFSQTEVSGHLNAYREGVRTLAAIAQISPNVMMGDLVNLSSDALAQMEAATQRRLGAYKTIFGEAWEQVFVLAAIAAGTALVVGAQVRWGDTTARSLEGAAKALAILATDLKVPVEALWERIPDVSEQDVTRWKSLASKPDTAALLAEALRANAEGSPSLSGDFGPADPPASAA